MEHEQTIKTTLDVSAVAASLLSFLNILTPIYGFIGATWTLLSIIQMITGTPIAVLLGFKKKPVSPEEKKDDAKQQ